MTSNYLLLGSRYEVVALPTTAYLPPFAFPASPYNYSDMTGFHNRISNPGGCPLKGYWTVIEDGGSPDREWVLFWSANTPTGSRVELYARASDDRAALANQQFVEAAYGVVIPGVRGQFLEVRTVLIREACTQAPDLDNLTICNLSKTLAVAPLADQLVAEGQDAAFEAVAIGTEPLTYQWRFNGQDIDGATTSSLVLPKADCLDQGAYSVYVQDATGDASVAGPAVLTVDAAEISIFDNSKASRYPAEITVSGLQGVISKVTVTLSDITHRRPDDINVLLVGPLGQAVFLMSHTGGTDPLSDVFLTLDDTAGPLPDTGLIGSGTYQPTAFTPPIMPSPAPAATGTALGIFNGTLPNGTWKLYVYDDAAGPLPPQPSKIAGSWCLTIEVAQP